MKKRLSSLFLSAVICMGLLLSACSGGGETLPEEGADNANSAPSSLTAEETDATPEETPAETASENEAASETAPEAEAAPAEETAPDGSFVYDRVVILGVDGGGNFFRKTDTPNIDRIFENGALTYDAHTAEPTISAQCWGSMLIGVTPEVHRLTNGILDAREYDPESEFPTVFRVIRENDADCELAAFCNWNPIYKGIIETNLGVETGTGDDAAVTAQVVKYVKNHDPKLLFVQFDSVDGAGHGSGYGSAGHLNQITTVDGYIGQIHDAYEERGFLDTTLFIVTADHGGSGTSHGGVTDAEKYVMYAAAGKSVSKSEIQDMEIRDNASIVLYALGLADKQPSTWTARVPSGLFEGVEAGERPVYELVSDVTFRAHESVPTPAIGSGKSVADLFGDRLDAYLPLDENENDAAGHYASETKGKLYYTDGYFGGGVQFDDGCILLNDYHPGKDSFSAALWVKTNGIYSDPLLLSNSDWNSGANPGYVFSFRQGDIKFNVGDGSNRMDYENPLPFDYQNGWMYVVLVVDREANEVRISYDFGKFDKMAIPAALQDDSYDGYDKLGVGQDGTGRYGSPLTATMDEVILVKGVLTDEDVAALASLYGAK